MQTIRRGARQISRAALALALLSGLAGCSDPPVVEGLTGVDLTVTHQTELDQLVVEVLRSGELILESAPVPSPPRQLEPAGEDLVVLLDEGLGGWTVALRVTGLRAGSVAALGLVAVQVVAREIVPATVHLGPPAVCGDGEVASASEQCDDGNDRGGDGCSSQCVVEPGYSCTAPEQGASVCRPTCDPETPCEPGQRCVGNVCVCDDLSCPGGCCDGARCALRSFETCGIDGSTCVACDPMHANSCSAAGACLCGPRESCAPGQRCVSGGCFCDEQSCPEGCCEAGRCLAGSVEHCGWLGGSCLSCDPVAADRCDETGACACGDGQPCRPGRRCVGGECVCDEVSCPEGCCAGTICEPLSLSSCGAPGSECVECDASGADGCSAGGSCLCGPTPACGPGERCEAGACLCDPLSCEGCCTDGSCQSGMDVDACGAGGAPCEVCPAPQLCERGVCSGCNGETCPDGCCSGATCSPRSLETCGVSGARCVSCDPIRADRCSSSGLCVCGSGPACAAGQHCVGGACLCDATSCPAGCCDGATCRTRSVSTCGVLGTACLACDPNSADTCSAAGECRCGAEEACAAGLRCLGGTCVCDAVSCPTGCCSGTACETRSFASCGTAGAACVACSPTRADACTGAGTCVCGTGPACAVGQRCIGGACVCDGMSCPTGCCDGTTCRPGTADSACGTGGAACAACPSGETCTGGSCSGCDATSCAAGCCSGSTCRAPSLSTCGVGGTLCVTCDPTLADRCDSLGRCACGSRLACAAGQRCEAGACICNALSCPAGCCEAGTCMAPSVTSCGSGGAPCAACDPLAADTCSVDGVCRCGARAVCSPPRICVSGSCDRP